MKPLRCIRLAVKGIKHTNTNNFQIRTRTYPLVFYQLYLIVTCNFMLYNKKMCDQQNKFEEGAKYWKLFSASSRLLLYFDQEVTSEFHLTVVLVPNLADKNLRTALQ